MKLNLFAFVLVAAGLLSACGNNTCQPGYNNGNCQYPQGYQSGGYYQPTGTGYPSTYPQGTAYPPTGQYPTPYGNPYNRPY